VRNNAWSKPTTFDEVCRRAAGRNAYNDVRKIGMLARRIEVAEMLLEFGPLHRGAQADIARRLGVARSTISRDVKALLRDDWVRCPSCERMMHKGYWIEVRRRQSRRW
jgi:DNA-binding MarR family transcriptional regulator